MRFCLLGAWYDNKAVLDDTLIEHIGNNASHNTAILPIVTNGATLD